MLKATEFAHLILARSLVAGACAIDATVGNGHDALFLAQQVGPSGRVFGFDVQPEALAATRQRLAQAGLLGRVTLHLAGHEAMLSCLPPGIRGRVRAICFNLGYRPGGNSAVATTAGTTLQALGASLSVLAPGGQIVVVTYPGHAGGAEEQEAVYSWAASLPGSAYRVFHGRFLQTAGAPSLFAITKHDGGLRGSIA